MKLEYLSDGSPECPLLRLYDFTKQDAEALRLAVLELASETAERIEIHRLPFVRPVGACRLALILQSWDQAIVRVGPLAFECGLTGATWEDVQGLIEPFAETVHGFQWLTGIPGELPLLLSASGNW